MLTALIAAIRNLEAQDVIPIAAAFTAIGWNKPASQYERYLSEQINGDRETLVAFAEDVFAGYLNVVWRPSYPPFRESGIPEIQDFNVLPQFRRKGVGSQLMERAERVASERSPIVGIGVGMTADYGAAQRLYVLRGYVPDGRGLVSHNRFPAYGEMVPVDDDLVLHFTKRIGN
jgi:GNAT superfamily N-acetyltransferase